MKRCLNCMEIYKDEFDVCPFCGFIEGTEPEIAYALPPGTVIADRYIIGTVIGAGGFGITYVAWDTKLENHKVLNDLNDTIGQNYHVVGQKHDKELIKTDRYTEFGTVNYEAKDWLGGVLCFSKEFDTKESSMNQPECIGYIGTMSDTFQDANYYMVESNLDDLMGVDFTCDNTVEDEDKAHGTYMAVGEYKDLTIKIYSKEYRIFPGSSIVYIYNAKEKRIMQ